MKTYTSEEVIDLVKTFINEYPNNVDLAKSFGVWLKQKEQSESLSIKDLVTGQTIWVTDDNVHWFEATYIGNCTAGVYATIDKYEEAEILWQEWSLTDPEHG